MPSWQKKISTPTSQRGADGERSVDSSYAFLFIAVHTELLARFHSPIPTSAVPTPSTTEELLRSLSEPFPEDVELAERLEGDVLVLGAAGKMGPTLVRRIAAAFRQAGKANAVYAVSRFSREGAREEIEASGAHAIAADLLEEGALASLPDCPNVFYLVGMKFGSSGREPMTWALNTYLPGRVAERFKAARIVALSTGNVYGEVPARSGGSKETDPPRPVGEYAQSCLGRERIFQHFALQNGTPVCLVRLNYAVEARYGVLLDVARKVYEGEPLSLEMGHVNVIWQGDANSACFRALELCRTPAAALNLTGLETLSVREVARAFGRRFGKEPVLVGEEGPTALLSDASRYLDRLGPPHVSAEAVIDLVADWLERGGPTLGKPTKFEVQDGRF